MFKMKFERQRTDWNGSQNPHWKGGQVEIPCLFCGKTVKLYPSVARKKLKTGQKTFCSRKCHDDFRRKPKKKKPKMAGKNHPKWSGPKYCAVCGDELHGLKRKNKTCGKKECETEQRSRSRRGKKNPRYVHGVHVYCKQCGKEITDALRLHKTYCNRKCMAKWQSENLSGENSPIWKGGYKDRNGEYPPEWTYSLRLKIRRRDSNTCQACGVKRKGLDVHHIDEDKMNCDESNLICLCRSCHRKVHGHYTLTELMAEYIQTSNTSIVC